METIQCCLHCNYDLAYFNSSYQYLIDTEWRIIGDNNISPEKMEGIIGVVLSLQPLFKKAYEEGLWFRLKYQDLWFSPEELKQIQKREDGYTGQLIGT